VQKFKSRLLGESHWINFFIPVSIGEKVLRQNSYILCGWFNQYYMLAVTRGKTGIQANIRTDVNTVLTFPQIVEKIATSSFRTRLSPSALNRPTGSHRPSKEVAGIDRNLPAIDEESPQALVRNGTPFG
jgi:hypothetical protein